MIDKQKLAVLLLAAGAVVGPVAAEEMTLDAARKAGGQKLTREELASVLPKLTLRAESERAQRTWYHNADGSLRATATAKAGRGSGAPTKAEGMWRVSQDGKYCVEVQWTAPEKWCRMLYKVGNEYFGFRDDNDATVADRRLSP
jgi:hypothetical protein